MGRPSKLSEKQWAEIQRRLIEGESLRSLAREFKVSESAARARLSAQTAQIKNVANQIVSTERAISELPITAQITAHNLASKLRAISDHLASAAHYGAMTAHRLSTIAHAQTDKIDDVDPMASSDVLQSVAGLTKMANASSEIALNLLRANKEFVDGMNGESELSEMTDEEIKAELAEIGVLGVSPKA